MSSALLKSPSPSRAGAEETIASITGRGFDQDEHGNNFSKLCNSFVLAGVGLMITLRPRVSLHVFFAPHQAVPVQREGKRLSHMPLSGQTQGNTHSTHAGRAQFSSGTCQMQLEAQIIS